MRTGPDFAPLAGGLAILGAWEGLVRLFAVPSFLLPPPSAVLAALMEKGATLLPAAFVTFGLALQALVIAVALGLALAAAFRAAPLLERAASPYALALQATPIVAIAPLVIIWVGVERPREAIVALSVVVAFFPVLASALAGLKAVDPGLDRLFRLHGAGPMQRFVRLELPTAAPYLLAGVKTAAGLSLVGAVVAEFVAGTGATGGLAWRIVEAGNRLETATMFAALVLLALLGVGLHAALEAVEKRLER
jgi:NitT/TauT family transport system permease protein